MVRGVKYDNKKNKYVVDAQKLIGATKEEIERAHEEVARRNEALREKYKTPPTPASSAVYDKTGQENIQKIVAQTGLPPERVESMLKSGYTFKIGIQGSKEAPLGQSAPGTGAATKTFYTVGTRDAFLTFTNQEEALAYQNYLENQGVRATIEEGREDAKAFRDKYGVMGLTSRVEYDPETRTVTVIKDKLPTLEAPKPKSLMQVVQRAPEDFLWQAKAKSGYDPDIVARADVIGGTISSLSSVPRDLTFGIFPYSFQYSGETKVVDGKVVPSSYQTIGEYTGTVLTLIAYNPIVNTAVSEGKYWLGRAKYSDIGMRIQSTRTFMEAESAIGGMVRLVAQSGPVQSITTAAAKSESLRALAASAKEPDLLPLSDVFKPFGWRPEPLTYVAVTNPSQSRPVETGKVSKLEKYDLFGNVIETKATVSQRGETAYRFFQDGTPTDYIGTQFTRTSAVQAKKVEDLVAFTGTQTSTFYEPTVLSPSRSIFGFDLKPIYSAPREIATVSKPIVAFSLPWEVAGKEATKVVMFTPDSASRALTVSKEAGVSGAGEQMFRTDTIFETRKGSLFGDLSGFGKQDAVVRDLTKVGDKPVFDIGAGPQVKLTYRLEQPAGNFLPEAKPVPTSSPTIFSSATAPSKASQIITTKTAAFPAFNVAMYDKPAQVEIMPAQKSVQKTAGGVSMFSTTKTGVLSGETVKPAIPSVMPQLTITQTKTQKKTASIIPGVASTRTAQKSIFSSDTQFFPTTTTQQITQVTTQTQKSAQRIIPRDTTTSIFVTTGRSIFTPIPPPPGDGGGSGGGWLPPSANRMDFGFKTFGSSRPGYSTTKITPSLFGVVSRKRRKKGKKQKSLFSGFEVRGL